MIGELLQTWNSWDEQEAIVRKDGLNCLYSCHVDRSLLHLRQVSPSRVRFWGLSHGLRGRVGHSWQVPVSCTCCVRETCSLREVRILRMKRQLIQLNAVQVTANGREDIKRIETYVYTGNLDAKRPIKTFRSENTTLGVWKYVHESHVVLEHSCLSRRMPLSRNCVNTSSMKTITKWQFSKIAGFIERELSTKQKSS